MSIELKYPPSELEKAVGTKTVCITGATGYVAGPIVQRLLALGHTVHATCRDPTKESSVQHLTSLPGASERLKLFKADLLAEGSFNEAVAGCDFVVHTASPFVTAIPHGKEHEMVITPALKGTENVLNSVNKTESVKRVVLTSSCAAVYGDPNERGEGHIFTEKDWAVTPSETVLPYYYSKKVAEEKAWEMAKAQDRWDLVTMCPALVLGPTISKRTDGESVNIIISILKGMPVCPRIAFGTTDVRVLAQAHCTALNQTAVPSDRYIVEHKTLWFKEMCDILKQKYPNQSYPKFILSYVMFWLMGPWQGIRRDTINHSHNKKAVFDSSKVWEIMKLPEYDIADSIQEMAEDLVAKGLVAVKS